MVKRFHVKGIIGRGREKRNKTLMRRRPIALHTMTSMSNISGTVSEKISQIECKGETTAGTNESYERHLGKCSQRTA